MVNRTRRLLEALGEVQPRKFKRLSKHVRNWNGSTRMPPVEDLWPNDLFDQINQILSQMGPIPPSYGVSIDDIVSTQPMTIPAITLTGLKPVEFIEVSFVLEPADKTGKANG